MLFQTLTLMKQFNQIWLENIKIKELKYEQVILIENSQNYKELYVIKNIFFSCMFKMYLISAEGYENTNVDFLTIKTTSEIWVSMKDVISGMGVKNISDLVLKEIYGICETKNPTEKEVNEYKMTKRKINKKFTNLSKKELNTKNNKQAYVRNDVMTTIIKRCRGEKKRHKSN